jgi:hypothetical protein
VTRPDDVERGVIGDQELSEQTSRFPMIWSSS